MRIVFDLQLCQLRGLDDDAASRVLKLVQAVAPLDPALDIRVFLSAGLGQVAPLRERLGRSIGRDGILAVSLPAGDRHRHRWLRIGSELLRELAIADQEADWTIIPDILLDDGERGVCSIGRIRSSARTAVFVSGDVISSGGRKDDPRRRLAERKLRWLVEADLLLVDSDAARHALANRAGIAADRIAIVPGSTDHDDRATALIGLLTSAGKRPAPPPSLLLVDTARHPRRQVAAIQRVLESAWQTALLACHDGGDTSAVIAGTLDAVPQGAALFDDVLYILERHEVSPAVAKLMAIAPGMALTIGGRQDIGRRRGSRAGSGPTVAAARLFESATALIVDDESGRPSMLSALGDETLADVSVHPFSMTDVRSGDSSDGFANLGATVRSVASRRDVRFRRAMLTIAAHPSARSASREAVGAVAASLAAYGEMHGAPRLLVDMSILARKDNGTGIQRVVRQLFTALRATPSAGVEVKAVRLAATTSGAVFREVARFAGPGGDPDAPDEVLQYRSGDVFVGLDLNLDEVIGAGRAGFFRQLREAGVVVAFVVYDLLPVRLPHFFEASIPPRFSRWLDMIVNEADMLICISRAVAGDLECYLAEHRPPDRRPLVRAFHLGADWTAADGMVAPPRREPADRPASQMILMVGTIEPRKGHGAVLAALEALWAQGSRVRLSIVGRPGWLSDPLLNRLRRHPALAAGHLETHFDADDATLDRLYRQASGLIAASYGEGFGLPLIEAAQRGVPLLLRDIAPFREIAGDHARYFTSDDPPTLARAIADWLAELAHGTAPQPIGLNPLTWAQSARQFLAALDIDEQQGETRC